MITILRYKTLDRVFIILFLLEKKSNWSCTDNVSRTNRVFPFYFLNWVT